MSGYAMDVSDLMESINSIQDIKRQYAYQSDIDTAAKERDRLTAIQDRVIGKHEVGYEGSTGLVATLRSQLEGIRSGQSRANLDTIYLNRAENGYSEGYLDENLSLALSQKDLSVSDFMNGAHFDTTGSFKHAMEFYRQSEAAAKAGGTASADLGYKVTLDDMFSTGKAYAGNESKDSATLKERIGLYKAGLKTQLGEKVYADAQKIGGGNIFTCSTHIERRILENGNQLKMAYEASSKDIALVGKTYQSMVKVDTIAGKLDTGVAGYNASQFTDARDVFITNLRALAKTDIINGLAFKVQEGLNGAPMRNAELTSNVLYRMILQDMSKNPDRQNTWQPHNAIDLSSKTDNTFYSTTGGTLDLGGWENAKGFGIKLGDGDTYYHSAPGSLDIFTKAFLTGNGTVPSGVAIGTTAGEYYGDGTGGHLHFESTSIKKPEDVPSTWYNNESSYSDVLSGHREDSLPSYLDTSILQAVLDDKLTNFQSYTQHYLGRQFNDMESVEYFFYLQDLYVTNNRGANQW